MLSFSEPSTVFCPRTAFARFCYFPVSVLASMHACAVWFELWVLGLGSVNADGS